MKANSHVILVTQDDGLGAHWKKAFGARGSTLVGSLAQALRLSADAGTVIWLDLAHEPMPSSGAVDWSDWIRHHQYLAVACSSSPTDDEAMILLDSGFMGYCHAYSDATTLRRVQEVVLSGNFWIGKSLMQRLLHKVNRAAPSKPSAALDWAIDLTPRERQVAILAANGAANLAIAKQCEITERTVKAHLGTVFQKLNITDRLQLALRVHGIH